MTMQVVPHDREETLRIVATALDGRPKITTVERVESGFVGKRRPTGIVSTTPPMDVVVDVCDVPLEDGSTVLSVRVRSVDTGVGTGSVQAGLDERVRRRVLDAVSSTFESWDDPD